MQQIQLYRSYPAGCSYITDNLTTNLIVDPETRLNSAQYEMLLAKGFRRSGQMTYRPDCEKCNACIPARIPVQQFKPRRSQRRCMSANSDLLISITPAKFSAEAFSLYEKYLNHQHAGAGMDNPTDATFTDFLCQRSDFAEFIEFRDQHGQLLCIACTDRLENSLSAVYTWYDPEAGQRGLGNYAILKQIELAKSAALEFVYLGYWIESVRKMAYKVSYKPCEILVDGNWRPSNT